jgi:hypothetical protein
MPILGIMASQISGHLWAPEGAYDSLATVTLSANTSSITFAGIPAGYKHLQLRATWANSTGADTWMRINGDTGSNYAAHYLNGNGSAAAGGAITGAGALGAYLGYSGSTTAYYSRVMRYFRLPKRQ